MKKIIFIIIWFLALYSSANAAWTLSYDACMTETSFFDQMAGICTCTNHPEYAWFPPEFYMIYTQEDMNFACWENTIITAWNPLTTIANNTSTNSISEAWNIMNWPIWYIIYFILWIALVSLVIYAIRKWF
jgi:hypothetical protein